MGHKLPVCWGITKTIWVKTGTTQLMVQWYSSLIACKRPFEMTRRWAMLQRMVHMLKMVILSYIWYKNTGSYFFPFIQNLWKSANSTTDEDGVDEVLDCNSIRTAALPWPHLFLGSAEMLDPWSNDFLLSWWLSNWFYYVVHSLRCTNRIWKQFTFEW